MRRGGQRLRIGAHRGAPRFRGDCESGRLAPPRAIADWRPATGAGRCRRVRWPIRNATIRCRTSGTAPTGYRVPPATGRPAADRHRGPGHGRGSMPPGAGSRIRIPVARRIGAAVGPDAVLPQLLLLRWRAVTRSDRQRNPFRVGLLFGQDVGGGQHRVQPGRTDRNVRVRGRHGPSGQWH